MATPPGLVPETHARPPVPPPPPRPRVPAWRRVLGVLLGAALVSAAVYVQTYVMTKDELDDPLTVSGDLHEELRTDQFSARLERVELARSVRVKKQFTTNDVTTTREIFLIAKVGATSPKRPLKLTSHLITADGLRFEATERVAETATMAGKWVQPGWWRSGFYFFEVPSEKIAGARVVVSENTDSMFGDQYLPETSFDIGLDAGKVRQMVAAAKDGYEVSG